uniref:Uncharacterized protein n=1 Tax=Oryza punctata TaxID=4537 RepID=A0A0E0ML58_ORYPU
MIAEALKKVKAMVKALKAENEKLKSQNNSFIEYYNHLEATTKLFERRLMRRRPWPLAPEMRLIQQPHCLPKSWTRPRKQVMSFAWPYLIWGRMLMAFPVKMLLLWTSRNGACRLAVRLPMTLA